MQTTCPECGTTFRVSQDQLGLRRGLVRCGRCNAVFNAYDTLLPELERAPMQSAAGPSAPPAAPTPQPDTWAEVAAELEIPGDLPDVPPRDALAAYLETAAAHAPPDAQITLEERDAASLPQKEAASKPESPNDILLSELPHRSADRAGTPKWKTALYLIAILLLTLALAGQLAYFLRGPGFRPSPE